MNWDAIGAVGEFIGAILVGATLIYLAFQLRQNTKALTSSTFQAVSSNMASNMEFFASDPTISACVTHQLCCNHGGVAINVGTYLQRRRLATTGCKSG